MAVVRETACKVCGGKGPAREAACKADDARGKRGALAAAREAACKVRGGKGHCTAAREAACKVCHGKGPGCSCQGGCLPGGRWQERRGAPWQLRGRHCGSCQAPEAACKGGNTRQERGALAAARETACKVGMSVGRREGGQAQEGQGATTDEALGCNAVRGPPPSHTFCTPSSTL